MSSPIDSPFSDRSVRNEHWHKIATSNNYLTKGWHLLAFGLEWVIPYIASSEASQKNAQYNASLGRPLSDRVTTPLLSQGGSIESQPVDLKIILEGLLTIFLKMQESGSIDESSFVWKLSLILGRITLCSDLTHIQSLDQTEIARLKTIISGIKFKEKDIASQFQEIVKELENRKAAAYELSQCEVPSIKQNQKLLLDFFGKNGYSEKALNLCSRLSSNGVKLLTKKSAAIPLWYMANVFFDFLKYDPPSGKSSRKKFEEFVGSSSVISQEIDTMQEIVQELFLIEARQTEKPFSSPSSGLIYSSPTMPAGRGVDQALYQEQFIKTVGEAAEKIKTESFVDCLEFIAQKRGQMAKDSRTQYWQAFGVRRQPALGTPMIGPYEKYRDHFFRSDKASWKKFFGEYRINYQIIPIPKGTQIPLPLTRIQINVDGGHGYREALWEHTSVENIDPALAECERIFNEIRALSVLHNPEGLEQIMKAVAELHWWLAQTTPYQRGSAAIAKMMAYALLEHHGIQPGGFGEIEPDCMALIQNQDEFINNYSKLMIAPPPRWRASRL